MGCGREEPEAGSMAGGSASGSAGGPVVACCSTLATPDQPTSPMDSMSSDT